MCVWACPGFLSFGAAFAVFDCWARWFFFLVAVTVSAVAVVDAAPIARS